VLLLAIVVISTFTLFGALYALRHKRADALIALYVVFAALRWPAPIFCTSLYESLGSMIGEHAGRAGGRGAAPTGGPAGVAARPASHLAANIAGGT